MTSQFAIRLAAHHVRNNGIIVYPTETVYGLGCDPNSADAVTRLIKLKQRERFSGFLLLAGNTEQLKHFIKTPDARELQLIHNTDEATSWITQAHEHAPPWLISAEGTIGFRITRHPVAQDLCEKLDQPIISTSANLRGRTPASNTLQCHLMFNHEIDYFLSSSIERSEKPSAIRRLSDGSRLR